MITSLPLTKRLWAVLMAGSILASACTRKAEPQPLLENNNVLVVLVDTLRADHLGAYGHSLATSPFLDQLVEESITFDRVVAPSSQTVPSTLSLLSGVYPNRHGNQYFVEVEGGAFRVPTPKTRPQVPDHVTLLSEQFLERGYKTGAVVANPWLRRVWGFGRGFETYDHIGMGRLKKGWSRGGDVNNAARELLEAWKDERFFLYLHYMDVHTPYEKEPRYKDEFPTDLSPISSIAASLLSYNAQVRAMDDHFRDLLATLRELGLDEKTLVVFTSDHGEMFGEHKSFGHGQALYQELVHVPLLLRHPKLKPMARRVDWPVSLVDVAPTIVELTLGKVNVDGDGISLVPHLRGAGRSEQARILYSELGYMTAAVRGDQKVIRSGGGKRKGSQWAFDLANDPKEQSTIESEQGWVREMIAAIEGHDARRFVDREAKETIDPATEERVRALGY